MEIKRQIVRLFESEKKEYSKQDFDVFNRFMELLGSGKIRTAQKVDGIWRVNKWIKKGILLAFKMGEVVQMSSDGSSCFFDKKTLPPRQFTLADGVRVVPGGTSVRSGAFVAPTCTIMPPAYVNIGAFVDAGTMIDSHALVGSCAQIGKGVHLSAAAQIGGVLEPIGVNPVIIEDNVFVGGNCGIYEGVQVCEGAIIAAGTILTRGTPVFDATKGSFLPKTDNSPPIIPQNSVVVSGARALKTCKDISLYCPVIIKYKDKKTSLSTTLEDLLR